MNSGLKANSPVIVSAFHHSLSNQGKMLLAGVLLLGLVLFALWPVLRLLRESLREPADPGRSPSLHDRQRERWPEPRARRVLRVGFGLLWIVDGILQTQSGMPLRLTGQVIAEAGSGSPSWLQDVVRWGATVWNNHPVTAATAAVWIQVGIGVWLLLVARGRWSRLGGLVSVGWALSVWVFGESLGGILAPSATWLFGAPGAVLFYAAAGALIALEERRWRDRRLGRRLLAGCGALLVAMAILQAWPGRGFWQGQGGALQSMVAEMAQTPQPHALSALLSDFAAFAGAHAVAVNLFVVVVLAATGVAFMSGRARLVRPALAALAMLCLADWVLVQDLGFLGGMGTDPNSAIPQLLLFIAAYLAMAHPPRAAIEPGPRTERTNGVTLALRPAARALALAGALSMTALGGVPFALAAVNPNATTLLAQSIDGLPIPVPGDVRPPDFSLVDQRGQAVTLDQLRGKVVLVTYLDPVCNVECPIIAQEFRQADALLGASAPRVELVAIDTNPLYRSPAVLRAFDRQEHLEHLPNWIYLTGTVTQLRRVWSAFGVEVAVPSGGEMVNHSMGAAALDTQGRIRWLANFDPGPMTSSTQSSFAVTLVDAVHQVLRESQI
jgi:cytochrome oxidase Cu insertion factor (SCO1/SenC/PrrC family)